MMRRREELIVVDTNVLVHLLRQDATGRAIEDEYRLTTRRERPILSSVVEGELLALARYRQWQSRKVDDLRELLAELVRVDAGWPEIVEAYAELHAEATRQGQPRGEDDLWIAATAKAINAALYTCNARHFAWMERDHITVHAIEQRR